MNEELKIIIRAVTDEAQKNMADIRKELEAIDKQADEGSKSIKESMAAIGKGAAVAVGAIVALTTAMVSLGKRSMEFQKSYGRLIAGFQSSGSTIQQATETYKNLFRFLGEADTATEAANLLVQLTNDSQNLAEWTTILQGVYAKLPDSLPVESLAEAANETAKTGVVTGALADALNWAGASEDAMNAALAETTSLQEREALLRSTLNNLYGSAAALYERNNAATLAYNDSQTKLDMALAEATKYIIPLMTYLNNLAATLLQVLKPAFETVSAVIIVFVQWIIAAVEAVGTFFGLFGEEGSKAGQAVADSVNNATGGVSNLTSGLQGAAAAAKELKKQTMGFDELNVVSSDTSASTGSIGGGAGAGGSITTPTFDASTFDTSGIDGFQEKLKEVEGKMQAIAILAGIAGLAIAGWKIVEAAKNLSIFAKGLKVMGKLGEEQFDAMFGTGKWKEVHKNIDEYKAKIKGVVGTVLIAAGAMALMAGYSDAWVNGIDWKNFALILGGIGLIVGGLVLKFGPMAGAIGLIAGGIAALVLGIKDLVTNGYSMEGVLMVLAGALAVGIGLVWALNSALLANPITWIVVGIAALVAAFIILWNECEGFRNFWKNLWQNTKEVFSIVWDWLKNFFTETIPNIFKKVINFIKDNWQALLLLIVNPFAGAFKLLYDNCEGFRNFIDKWVGKIKGFFKDLVSGIKNTFSGIGSWFSDIFTKIGNTIGDKVSGAVKGAINAVLKTATNIINGFIKAINVAIKVINAIPGVDIKKLELLDVPKLAKGGIVTSATTAIIGEAGKEAVLPLENNTGWIDMLADRLAARNSAPSKIVLALDGKELGWANINSINNITKQTGALQLVLA